MPAGTRSSNLGITWKERTSIASLFPSQHPTKGRPRFNTTVDRRSGSPGCFGSYDHSAGEIYSVDRKKATELRSGSVRSQSARGASRRPGQEGGSAADGEAAADTKAKPEWRGTSPSPGIPPREFTYSANLKGDAKKDGDAGSVPTSARGRSADRRRSASQQQQNQHVPAGLEANVAALLRRDLARKSKEELAAEETQRRIKTAVAVRFAMVPKDKRHPSHTTTNGTPRTAASTPTSHQPMHLVPRDGLRVQYYDKGRKMTTAELWSEERLEQRHASPSPSRGGSTATSMTTESAMSGSVRAADRDEDPVGQKLWVSLQDSEDAVKTIPSSFFEAIKSLKSEPPHRVLFALHCTVLLIEPHCQVVPLPKNAIWPAVKDALVPGNLVERLMHIQLDDVSLERVAILKDMMAAEVYLQERMLEDREAAKKKKEEEQQKGEEEKKDDGNEEAAKEEDGDDVKKATPEPEATEKQNETPVPEFDSVVGQKLRQQVDDQSPQAAQVVQWMLSFFAAHDHIVRDRKAAMKYRTAAAKAAAGGGARTGSPTKAEN